MKRPPRIFTEGDKRYILINGKKYYLKTKSNDKKLVSIVINNIMNKVKRRKRKGILQKKPSKLESSSSSSSSSTTSNTYNNNTLTYANSYNKYQQLITDMKVEEARNELNKQKQINKAFQPTSQQFAITGLPGTTAPYVPPLPGTTQFTALQNQLTDMQKKIDKATKRIEPIYQDDKGNEITQQQYNQLNQDRAKQIADAQKQLSQASNQLSNTNAKLQTAEKQLLTKEKDVKDKENEITKLQNDVSKLMTQKTNSDQELKKNQNEIIRLSNQITEKEKDLMNEQIKVGDLQNKVIELEKTKNVFESNIQTLKQQEDDIKQKNADLEKQNKKLEADKKNVLKAQTKAQYDDAIDMGNLKGEIKVPFLDGKTEKIATYQYDSNGNIYQSEISYKYGKNEIKNLMTKYKITTLKDDPYEYAKSIAKEELQKQIPKLDIQPVEEIPEPEQPESPPLTDKGELEVPDAPKKPEQPEEEKPKMKIKTKKNRNKGHEEAEGDGLYDYELDDIMKGYKKYGYLGCFTLDEIKKINPENKKRISFFLNHDEHWMAVYLDASKDLSLEFMDPFGKNPPTGFKEAMNNVINKMAPKLYLKYKINQIPQQNIRSDNCGAIAARFLMDRYAGKSFKEATNYTIEKSEKKAEGLRKKFGYGAPKFGFI